MSLAAKKNAEKMKYDFGVQMDQHKERYEKCGLSTIVLKDVSETGDWLIKKLTCNDYLCPKCAVSMKEHLRSKIQFYTDNLELHFFVTLTTKHGYDELQKKFDLIMHDMNYFLDEDRIIQTNKLKNDPMAHSKAQKIIEKRKEQIIQHDIELQAHKMAHMDSILAVATKKGVYYKKMSTEGQKAFRKDNRKAIYDGIRSRKKKILSNSETYNTLRDKIVSYLEVGQAIELSYIRVCEFHSGKGDNHGKPHFHILINRYIPFYFIDKHSTEDDQINDVSYLKEYIVNHNSEIHDVKDVDTTNIANYVSKLANYVTKDDGNREFVLEKMLKEQEKRNEKIQLVAKSNNIKLKSDPDEDKKKYEKRATLPHEIKVNSFELPYYYDLDMVERKVIEEGAAVKSVHAIRTYERALEEFTEEIDQYNFIIKERLEVFSKNNYLTMDKMYVEDCIEYGYKDFKMSDEQQDFVRTVNENGVTFLLGRAGTGKSQTIANMISCLQPKVERTAFLTYTGKAIGRIKELLGHGGLHTYFRSANTVHRTCSSDFKNNFLRNHANQLDVDFVVIDEVGMIGRDILAKLLLAIPDHAKIVFAGDDRQLEPIQYQSIIPVLKVANTVIMKELTKNFRSNGIVNEMAQKVLAVEEIQYELFNPSDVSQAVELIKQGYQVLVNTNALRKAINKAIHQKKTEITHLYGNDYNYEIGDKVIITANDNTKKVFNGDVATIVDFNNEGENQGVTLELEDGRRVFYTRFQSKKIEPASAITVHKSQGSEYKKIAVFINKQSNRTTSQNSLNTNRLLYTAVTRAKENIKVFFDSDETAKTTMYSV